MTAVILLAEAVLQAESDPGYGDQYPRRCQMMDHDPATPTHR